MVGNRLYIAAILLNWLAAMAWLVTYRVLPPFYGGEGPVTRPSNQIEPIAWRVEMAGRECGLAVLQAVPGDGGAKEVHSLLRLDHLEEPEGAPAWLKPVLKSLRTVSVTMRTVTVYDGVDRLSSFSSRLRVSRSDLPVEVRGRVVGDELSITLRAGEYTKRLTHPWPGEATLASDLTPTGRLLPVYQGRRWTSEVYSPLGPPSQATERIEAEVTDRLRLTQGGETFDAWRVEYRLADPRGSTDEGRLRAVLYVAEDGRIMKQESWFLGTSVTFLRESEEVSLGHAALLELDKYATLDDDARDRVARPHDQPLAPGDSLPGGEASP